MRFVCRRIWSSGLTRRLCAAATLVCYVLTAFGVPLPAAPVRKGSVPFICQSRACGCQSAEQCWSGCCCFTPEQRWAWARQQHVEPPDYAEAPRSGGWQSARKRDGDAKPVKACCSEGHEPAPPCCEPPKEPEQPLPEVCSDCTPPAAKTTTKTHHVGWTLGVEALKCKGQSVLWVTTGVIVRMASAPIELHRAAPTHTLTSVDATPHSRPLAPPDPPPRRS
jgi:hypothetical protein